MASSTNTTKKKKSRWMDGWRYLLVIKGNAFHMNGGRRWCNVRREGGGGEQIHCKGKLWCNLNVTATFHRSI